MVWVVWYYLSSNRNHINQDTGLDFDTSDTEMEEDNMIELMQMNGFRKIMPSDDIVDALEEDVDSDKLISVKSD